jgi:hypothetical protein
MPVTDTVPKGANRTSPVNSDVRSGRLVKITIRGTQKTKYMHIDDFTEFVVGLHQELGHAGVQIVTKRLLLDFEIPRCMELVTACIGEDHCDACARHKPKAGVKFEYEHGNHTLFDRNHRVSVDLL